MGSIQGKRIHVIDDEPGILDLVEATFTKEGAIVFRAGDGPDGIRRLLSHHPNPVMFLIARPYPFKALFGIADAPWRFPSPEV